MKQTEITKKYKALYWVFSILSFVVIYIPVFVYVVKGYIEADLTTEKVGLTCTIMISIILVSINFIFKYHIRSTLWILLLGIYYCLDNILLMIILIAMGTIVDEFLLTPLKKSFKNKYTINKEIDKRL